MNLSNDTFDFAIRKRVKTIRRVATRSLALVLVCILAVANIAAGPLWGDSASADVSGFSKESSELTSPVVAATGLVYNGTRQQGYPNDVYPTARYTGNGGNLEEYHSPFYVKYTGINGTEYDPLKTLSAGYQEINDNAPTNAGSYQVVFTVPDDAPFILLPNSLEFSIAKAPALTLSPLSAPMIDAAGYQREFDLASMLNLRSDLGGGPAYSVTTHTANGLTAASIDPKTGTLTLTSKDGAGLSTSDTVTVALTKMGHFEDSTVQVNVGYTAKPDAMIGGIQVATGLVYDGEPQQGYIGTPQATYQVPANTSPNTYDGPFTVTYTGTDADGSTYGPTAQAPTAAGIYRATFALPQNAPCTGQPAVLDFAIDKASLVFHAENASMTAGDAVPKLGYNVSGLQGSDRVTREPLLTVVGDTASAGSCTIAISGAAVDNQACYNVSYASGTLTVSAAPQPEPKLESQPQPQPEPAPEPKPEPAPETKTLASTGDTTLPRLLALSTGLAALIAGASFALSKRPSRQRLHSDPKQK